jgi:hypothetical protein
VLVLATDWGFSICRTFGRDGVTCDVYRLDTSGKPEFHTQGKPFPSGPDADAWGVEQGLLKEYQSQEKP